ncbi:hypothetical protein GM921_00460 [Pedobacter sp. LMG 31464]|uniref:Uncharacterized protein n=1 Tax=Pedobacter planticolens TaxID=2679964 RepID=A0A923ITN7_9SPHI|nr:hypothetical protein [Pedobacter planticolens]MBB2143941.1 hypothetical protein [Pedobacter planticolens]
MKTIKKLNFAILAAFFGLVLVLGMSAFQPKQDTQYWFEVDTSTGDILSYQGNEEPGGDCVSSNPSKPVCSVAFDETDISDPMNPEAPISNVASDPSNQIDELRRLLD